MDREDAPVRAVARAADVLLQLATGPQTLGEVADGAKLSKATAHRILASLAHGGLAIQDPASGEYLLGPGCIVLANSVIGGMSGLGAVARAMLEQLRDETLESVTLHIRAGAQRICIEELPSPQHVKYTAGVGVSHPIHTGSAGKVLLAFTDSNIAKALLDNITLDAVTESTITDRRILERELQEIREQGYAQSRGERVPGAAAISVPVWSPDQDLVAALSVLGPSSRLTDSRLRDIRPIILSASGEIHDLLVAADGRIGETADV